MPLFFGAGLTAMDMSNTLDLQKGDSHGNDGKS
jgi:hypothetical protein